MQQTTLPVDLPFQRPGLTPRGADVVHIMRLAEAIREMDAADREYVAPLIADCLVDVCQDITAPPKRA